MTVKKTCIVGLVLWIVIATPLASSAYLGHRLEAEALTQLMPPMKGMTLNAWSYEAYNSSQCDQSLSNLASIKANWVLLTVFWFMNTSSDVEIHPRPDLYTASDSSLIHAIQKGQELGMKIALKPMVDVVGGSWRGVINPSNWTVWFQNYRSFINQFADIAQANNVELLVIGTELKSSQQYEAEWRVVISQAGLRFSGELTYAANWDSYSPSNWVKFWDALDYVGVDAYFPLTSSYNPTLSQLISAWSSRVNELSSVSTQTGRKILFTEIGYCSQNGTNTQPWNWEISSTLDMQEQADCYQAALEVFKSKTWFEGWFWWNWETDPNAGGPTERHYTPQNKPAQSILNQYYYEVAPDIAVTSVTCSKTIVEVGGTVGIEATVANQGIYPETFNLTAYANNTVIETQTITLANGTFTIIDYLWNTLGFVDGNYTTKVYAWPIPYETDITDNTLTGGSVFVGEISDVAVTEVLLSKAVVCQGFTMNAQSTVQNLGINTVTFDVSLTANSSSWASETVTLGPGEIQEVDFTINSTGMELGSYSIAVVAAAIPNETDLTNNVLAGGHLLVTLPGDIASPYGVVDIFDIVQVAAAFQATPGAPNWNANADLNNDVIIDIFDIVVVAAHFGDSY